ncbi:molybdopterin converting factor [Aeropyrum pernix]|uniref:Molybdopterin converting factor n=1 Tax=Aeropyrum pernix TaxID=56636 RepID=A0A401H9X6_AERPX|nr:molybdenum cofactor biosynthesis protein MoaE [Aeropyrum pernix]GBF09241.1 molybdopterin converting factor [Aeropyrum pernix]
MSGGWVELRLYTILKDAAGAETVRVPCPPGGVTLGEALREAARTSGGLERALDAVSWEVYGLLDDGSRLALEDRVACGSRVHIIPPPSGGGVVVEARLLKPGEHVDIAGLVARAASASPANGAVAVFVGTVKSVVGGVRVEKLFYEAAWGVAERVIESILREEAGANGLSAAIVYHYTGERRPGETTIVAVVAGASRDNVYPGLQRVVDRVKREAPIWKVEYREGGVKAYILGDRVVTLVHPGRRPRAS